MLITWFFVVFFLFLIEYRLPDFVVFLAFWLSILYLILSLLAHVCSSVCGSTWDFICYIENFCVANLLKMGMVFILSYFGELINIVFFVSLPWYFLYAGISLVSVVGNWKKAAKSSHIEVWSRSSYKFGP